MKWFLTFLGVGIFESTNSFSQLQGS